MPESESRASLLCLVFTDLVDSTALKARLGDAAVSELMARYHERVLALASEGGGREIDSAGDGFFLTFEAPSAAVQFALRLQLLHFESNELPVVRVGVHLGEVTERAAPAGSSKPTLVEGIAVDLAARIGALAGGEQVLMSQVVFDAARQRLDEGALGSPVGWRAHGPYLLKGIDEPVEIGEAGFEQRSPLTPPGDSEKGRSATAAGDELTLGWRPAVGLTIPGRVHWQLVEQLGHGAIGEVWLARHEGTGAKRVFKFCFQADSLRSLKREVVLLRLLKESLGERPDIAQVIDWEFDQPPYFLETEHSEAGDLVAWGKAQGGIDKVPLETRIDLVAQIGDALAAAHGAGVLHKDLKPANVLIHEKGGQPRVCLADFGIGLVTSREALEVPGITVAGLTEALLSSSVETGAGTRLYMAPEVMEGHQATELSDVYSLGVILYQVVAGNFGRALATGWERDVPDPLLREDIAACVDRDPANRVAGPAQLAARLRALPQRRAGARAVAGRRRGLRVGLAVALAAVLLAGGWWGFSFYSKVRWARDVAGPEILRLVEANDYAAAYDLATEVEEALGANPSFDPVWEAISTTMSFTTEPAGATVSYRPYADPEGAWRAFGTTPIEEARLPRVMLRWRVEKDGFVTREFAHFPPAVSRRVGFAWSPALVLDPEPAPADGTIPVAGRSFFAVPLGSFPTVEAFELERFYIDRTEVTNEAYQEFVAAGGYRDPSFWQEAFVDGSRTLEFEEAVARFLDSTGRPGPADWVLGEFPEGRGSHPVAGVSWFEAAAYAAFRGKSLPTVYHWGVAALPDVEIVESLAPDLAAQSNMGSDGPLAVGSTPGLSAAGALDMAGNVSEWVWNASGDHRYLLGGSWRDPGYALTMASTTSPWRREENFGFRLTRYASEPEARFLAPISLPGVDFAKAPAASPEEFAYGRRRVQYQRTPLRLEEEAAHTLASGVVAERVSIDAAYRRERLPIYTLAPENAAPPYQAVVWMGGLNILMGQDTTEALEGFAPLLEFLRKSGRLVVQPVFASSLERNDGTALQRFNGGNVDTQREMFVDWVKDLGRTLDYLEERGDVDMERVAFAGMSLGALAGNVIAGAHQDRIAAQLLWSGGFAAATPAAGAPNLISSAETTTIPVLMLNGREDFIFPYGAGQVPFFARLGTPAEHKRHVVWKGGHFGFPLGEFIKENLAFLDRYLGPVGGS